MYRITDVERWNALREEMVIANDGTRVRIPRVYEKFSKVVGGKSCVAAELFDESRQNIGFVDSDGADPSFLMLVVFERHGAVICEATKSDLFDIDLIPGFSNRNGSIMLFKADPEMAYNKGPSGSSWLFMDERSSPNPFAIGRFTIVAEVDTNHQTPILANTRYPTYSSGFRSLTPLEIVLPVNLSDGNSGDIWMGAPWAPNPTGKTIPGFRKFPDFAIVQIYEGFSVSSMIEWNESTPHNKVPKSLGVGGISCLPSTEPIRAVVELFAGSQVMVTLSSEAISKIQMLFEASNGQFFIMKNDEMPKEISMVEYAAMRKALERAGCFMFEPGFVVRTDLSNLLKMYPNGNVLLGQLALNIAKKVY